MAILFSILVTIIVILSSLCIHYMFIFISSDNIKVLKRFYNSSYNIISVHFMPYTCILNHMVLLFSRLDHTHLILLSVTFIVR